MLALEILQNGKRLLVANLKAVNGGYITADVGIHGENGALSVIGYGNASRGGAPKMRTWKDKQQLGIGDEITIRLIDTSEPSSPATSKTMTEDD
jgi:hypothetical protein